MSSSPGPWAAVEDARTAWRRADDQLPRLRALHGDLSTLHDALVRNNAEAAHVEAVLASLERLGGDSQARRTALSFLTEPVLPDDQTVGDAFRHGRAVTTEADAVASSIAAYVGGSDWESVRSAVSTVVEPQQGPMAIDSTTLSQVLALFGVAIEAGIAAREASATALSERLSDAYDGIDEPIPELDEQPIALLPVRLETRFVDADRDTDGPLTDLLVRVYPDQIHADSHEAELTDDEVLWGQNFWATLWHARHPDPSVVPDAPDTPYLQDRLPNRRLRELVADIDPSGFAEEHARRYDELKERAWSQLLDRFGRERAAYVVHALEPTDAGLASDLLDRPPEPDYNPFLPVGDGGEDRPSDDRDVDTSIDRESSVDRSAVSGGPDLSDALPEDATRVDLSETDQRIPADALSPGFGSTPELPEELPSLSFPEVERRPDSWTKQARARLLPDRWIAIAEWTDRQGSTQRTAVAGDPIREPLPVGPSAESVAEDDLASDETDSPAPERTDWMVDFDAAESVGMGLRLHLSGLAGFDPHRGFDRLSVVGVKASMDAEQTPAALESLLDAHHYTDGLAFLDQGTPTNNYDDPAGGTDDDPLDSMAVECVPPLVADGDRTDGDLLARALAIGPEDGDHVFANVENAGGTQQRDARHVNSALWPATLGYFFQDLLLDSDLAGTESLWNGSSPPADRRDALQEPMLWLDAYRRHFVRYVRGRGPFPAMRVGKQPYGILPARAIETERSVTLVDQDLLAGLQQGDLSIADAEVQGADLPTLVEGGVEPRTLLSAGATPDQLLDAGSDPKHLLSEGVSPKTVLDASGLAPDALTQDGIGLLSTSRVTKARLRSAGVPVDDLEASGLTVRALARGEVTDDQLTEAGVTTNALADVLLPRQAKSLGITPDALERAGVTPAALLNGEISAAQVEKLGLDTRAVADVILPKSVREMGVTPKTLEDAGISPTDLLNGTVTPEDLEAAGVTTEALAEALLPAELIEFGITPQSIDEAGISVADLFNGDLGVEDLQRAGLDTSNLADAVLPQSFRDAGITPESLESAGITPDAVLNGLVTPEDVVEAGITPEALAEAGVLPDALANVGQALGDLIDAGLKPMELLEGGLTPKALLEAGVDPGLLVEAGLAPKHLVDAGMDVVELAAKGSAPVGDLLEAGASPSELARVGATVADLAGGDLPAQDLVKAGFTAVDLLESGADALGVAKGGARPTQLREAGVDAGTLQEAGKAAGSLRMAGYSASELLEAGYTASELLNGGFSPEELTSAGIDPSTVSAVGRSAAELLGSGYAPADLRSEGYDARQLLDAGVDAAGLVAAGYSAGELKDAGLSTKRLAEAGLDVGELRAAGADVASLTEAGIDARTLKEAGVGAQQLLETGVDPQALLDAGFASAELEVAGVDVDALAEDVVSGGAGVDDIADAAVSGLQYAATVLEDPDQAERDTYAFSFDPALPTLSRQADAPAQTGGVDGDGQTDGGLASGFPVVRPLSIDDRLPARLEKRLRGFGTFWADAADSLPFGGDTDEDALLNALKREGLSADVRQQTMAYSGERAPDGADPIARAVQAYFQREQRAAIRDVLETADATDLDPRLAAFYTTDATREDVRTLLRGTESTMLHFFYDRHFRQRRQGTIEPHEMVDGDIGQFVDVLLGSTVSEVQDLSNVVYAGQLSLDTSALDLDDGEWGELSYGEKRGRLVNGIETADDPLAFARSLVAGNEDAPGYSKLLQLGENQAQYGDSGALRSLLRLLLQYGTLQAYVAARRRLGVAYDDLPGGWPDPAYYGEEDGPLESVFDPAPKALGSHPNVGSMATVDDEYTYADALYEAAANYTSSTSIDPRLSEFTDSLRYLGGCDPADLATLTRETLDLASHRIDAWWTSLATKRLFELREAQGTYDSESGFDHEAWSGGGSDVPRATLDPGLLSSVTLDTDSGATDQPSTPGVGSQFDPAKIADLDIDLGGTDGAASQPDGGFDAPTIEDATAGDSTGDETSVSGDSSMDVGAVDAFESAAKRTRLSDPSRLHRRTQSDPGLYVGGYGFVENLAADVEGSDDPEYVHAPSEQHATTAALLRSGSQAHDADEGDNAMAVDLSAERVRAGLRLIRGVRRGQSLGELLGYRFERRLHEETVTGGADLMQYVDVFRAAFPATLDKLQRPDERDDETKAGPRDDLAARDALDGYRLLKQWEEYPFGRGADLPAEGSTPYGIVDDVVTELSATVDAAGDLLTAESVHQLGQGNFDRAGGSVGALARGEPLPEPEVARTPRSETGVTHRQCLLFGTPAVDADATPRTAAEPTLASWVAGLLPDHDTVECVATYRWGEETTDPATGSTEEIERSHPTSARLSELDLGPLDVLLLFGADREAARSELQQRLVYRLLRDRPTDPAVPADATIELELTTTETEDAIPMADLLELARSLRELIQDARPADAEDLAHPTDRRGEGYDARTADTLQGRADAAQDRLFELATTIDERLAVLDAEHAVGDGIDGLPAPPGASADGGAPLGGSWDGLDGGVTLPGQNAPALDVAFNVTRPTLTEQVTDLAEAVETVDADVPLSTVETVAGEIDPDALRSELASFVNALPVGEADPDAIDADVTVRSGPKEAITGTLGTPVTVPDPSGGDESDGDTGDEGEADTDDSDDGSADESGPITWMPPEGTIDTSLPGYTVEPTGSLPEIELTDTATVVENLDSVTLPGSAFGGGDGDSTGQGDTGGEQSGDDSATRQSGPDWSTSTATVRLWGTDGLAWFERTAQTTPRPDGRFTVELDLSGIDPGTPFQVSATVDGTVVYSASGRVVADDPTSDAQTTLRETCPNLRRLVWLRARQPLFDTGSGPSAALDLALDGLDFEAVQDERDAADPASSAVTSEDLDAVDALLSLETLDPGALAGSLDTAAAPASRLGLDRVVDVTGDGAPADAEFWFAPNVASGDVRARIARTLDNPALYNAGAAPWLLSYHHDAGAMLHSLDGGSTTAAYLDAFLSGPAWTIRYLDDEIEDPTDLVRDLTAWLYAPSELSNPGDLATALHDLASALGDLPALATLFSGLPTDEGEDELGAFARHLQSLASTLGTGAPSLPDPEPAKGTFDAAVSSATTDLASDAHAEATALSPVVGVGVDRSVRRLILERLREPMLVAASYGVFGGTPTDPDGTDQAAEDRLLEQARALLERLRARLTDAAALDPRLSGGLADRPVPQRVEDQTDRLETLFGDGFTVLPPFDPSNPEELAATFTDDGLVPGDGAPAETWLQRAAAFRENVDQFREARSYAEALSGTLTPSLTVGQVPYEPGDTWTGVDGVEPAPGKLSLVAQFGPGVTPGTADGRLTGLFVDEWTEGVPESSETTGIALNYDDPGVRPPQSILLATPPEEPWTLDDLVEAVDETTEYMKRRAVDTGDLDENLTRLFPALYFAQQSDPEPPTPRVEFGMLDWYDRPLVTQLLPPEQVLDLGGWSFDG